MGDGSSDGGHDFSDSPTIIGHDGQPQKAGDNEFDEMVNDAATLAKENLQFQIQGIRGSLQKKES